MKNSREYQIAFVALKPEIHDFAYELNDSFFESIATPEFVNANIKVKLSLDKKPLIFLLHFEITGTVTIACDRCGDDFTLTLWDEFDTVVKLVDEEQVALKNEEDPEVLYISRGDSLLDVAPLLYELCILCLPIQIVHPDDENNESTCNKDVLNYLKNQTQAASNKVWEGLKNINKNKN